MNKLIRTTLMFLMMLLPSGVGLTSCSHDDEPDWDYYFHDLDECPAKGVYEGYLCVVSQKDDIGVWCQVTKTPDDYDENTCPNDRLYISRKAFRQEDIKTGAAIQFQIISFDTNFPPDFPYGYVLYANHSYYIANINLIAVNP